MEYNSLNQAQILQIPVMNIHRSKDGMEVFFARFCTCDLSTVYLRDNTSNGLKYYLGTGMINTKDRWLLPANSQLCICGVDGPDRKEDTLREV